ncbi:MAG: class I SAM-dependent methyltransferase [Rhodopila sp.]
MKRLKALCLPMIDLLLVPWICLAGLLLRNIRRAGIGNLPLCKAGLLRVGVFPVRNHYYEPRFDYRDFANSTSIDRRLPGIDWNIHDQLRFLAKLNFANELGFMEGRDGHAGAFTIDNANFGSGDAEYWYQVVRFLKPRRIYEIGSGHSTLVAAKALHVNRSEDDKYQCLHLCVEPFEMPWLERTDASVLRSKVEDLDPSLFLELRENDVLFIDSSHMIRPAGDVLFEYLEILPTLAKGVYVHIHDIFSPGDYPLRWLAGDVRFWNEQYLLEAFLSHNASWEVVGALNLLHHHHYDRLKRVAPFLERSREPGSFYMRRIA